MHISDFRPAQPQTVIPPSRPASSTPTAQNDSPGPQPAPAKSRSSVRGLASLSAPYSSGINPATAIRSPLSNHFKIGDLQLLNEQYSSLMDEMASEQRQRPDFKNFLQTRLAQAFPQLNPLDPDKVSFNSYTSNNGVEQLKSSEPIMTALSRAIREIYANPSKQLFETPGVRTEFVTRPAPDEAVNVLQPTASLHTIARSIATEYAQTLREYWTTPQLSANSPSPQDQLLWVHKQQLSTLAAIRKMDGTLSPASKELIDNALRYPSLEERESKLPDGSRPGVYPITIDDGTVQGAAFAGAFMITSKDGSSASTPTWPATGREIKLNDQNGPVVLYTPSEGFEEFATPALLREALAQRLDSGGPAAELLRQSLPLSLQNRASPPTGDDLMLGVAPLAGDVQAEGINLLLQRQGAEVDALMARTFTPQRPSSPTSTLGPTLMTALDDAADWSAQVDGSNAMLARNEKLAEKGQPGWLKNLSPAQELLYSHLEGKATKSAEQLAPLLENIPSLSSFATSQMNEALKQAYPQANVGADQLMVKVVTKTRFHLGRSGIPQPPSTTITYLSLSDLALKNPSHWEMGESHKHTETTMTLALQDTKGSPVPDDQRRPITLDTQQLKHLVYTADVGGEYTKLLETRMAPDAASGPAADLHKAWKASNADLMVKEAFLAQLNPGGFQADASTDKTLKRGVQWINAVLDHPDPAQRAKVDGQTIVANTLLQLGLPVRGVMVIGNQTDASVVLYSPGAPDGLAFRELPNLDALTTLLEKKEWQAYTQSRKSPTEKDDFQQSVDAARRVVTSGGTDLLAAAEVLDKGRKRLAGSITLKPMETDIHDELFTQQTRLLIDKADFQSTSSAEVNAESTRNKIMFGVEVGSLFLDFIPVIGKGISTGVKVGSRLGRAALKTIQGNARHLPGGLLTRGGRVNLFADFTALASGLPHVPSTPLRPVFRAAGTPVPAAPVARSLLTQGTPPPGAPVPPAVPSTSAGIRASQAIPSPVAQSVTPPRDLSAYSVPEDTLRGVRPDANGIYQVGENCYIRYTDSTGINRPYQIYSVFNARHGRVSIIDPKVPSDAPSIYKNVAFMESTGTGEWRLSELPGAKRHRGRTSPPGDEYMDRVLSGQAARDFDGNAATTGQLRRWFRRDVQDFFARMSAGQLPARPAIPAIPDNATSAQLIKSTLAPADVNGLVIGELHDEPGGYKFIIENMANLKANGVTTIYLENAPYFEGSPVFGAGAYQPQDARYAYPRPYDYSTYAPNSPTPYDLIQEADKHGIKVIGLEHPYLTAHSDNFAARAGNQGYVQERLSDFNYYATKIIGKTPPGEKWVALVGNVHMNTAAGVPGVAELNKGVGISIIEAPQGAKSLAIPPAAKDTTSPSFADLQPDIEFKQNVDDLRLP